MKRKQETKCPLWLKLTFYQAVALSAPISASLAGPANLGGVPRHLISARAARPVTGRVTDTKGEAITGTTVVVKGRNTGAITDADGKYTIDVPDDQAILVFPLALRRKK